MGRTYKTFDSILDDYCGTYINNQFYNGTTPMLLTEHQLGTFSAQIITEYSIILLIAWSFQMVLFFYFRTIKRYFNEKCKASQSPESQNTNMSKTTRTHAISMRILLIYAVVCGIFVMVHFFNDMGKYYAFVNRTVDFASNSAAIQPLIHQNYESVDQCIDSGLGRIACPALFERYTEPEDVENDNVNPPYTLEEAEHICKFAYNMFIAANPRIFQYSFLAAFVAVDTMLYLLVIFLVSVCPCVVGRCTVQISACFCCCCCNNSKDSLIQAARCCCHVTFCKGPCCLYCLCGSFGIFVWVFECAYIMVLVIVLILVFLSFIVLFIYGPAVGILFIIGCILILPMLCCHCCCFVKSEETGNSKDTGIRLRVKETLNTGVPNETSKFLRAALPVASYVYVVWFLFTIQPFISATMIYYVVDGPIFLAWHYFEPFLVGGWEYVALFYGRFGDTDQLIAYCGSIVESMSWRSFALNSDLDAFRYCVFMLRFVLEIVIAIVEVMLEDVPSPRDEADDKDDI
eukprot:478443_1